MEHNDPSRRQYPPSAYAGQQQQQQQQSQQAQGGGAQPSTPYGYPGSVERFRQASFMQQSPASAPSASRAGGDTQQMYAFPQGGGQYGALPPLSSNTMQHYAPDPQTPEQHRNPQYSQYTTPNVIYGMGQPQAQQPSQSPFEQVSQYSRQRPSAAGETFGPPFGVAQTPQYYLPGQAGPASAPAPELAGQAEQQIPSQYPQQGYQQPGPSAPQAYSSTMLDPVQSAAYPTYAQPAQQYATQMTPQSVDQAFNNYQTQVRSIFTHAREGSLSELHGALLDISHYLLGNAEALGLTRDEESMHDDRIRLWDEFNRAWLVTLQRQFDLMQDIMMQTGQAIREPLSLMTMPALEHLSRELVRLCDSVEKHGLVDYQMGVAEEEIMELLLRCISQLDPNNNNRGDTGAGAESTTSSAARGRR